MKRFLVGGFDPENLEEGLYLPIVEADDADEALQKASEWEPKFTFIAVFSADALRDLASLLEDLDEEPDIC